MMGFGEGLVKFAQWLWGMWPIRIIRSYQRGVRFRKGIPEQLQLEPGIRAARPVIDEIEVIPVCEDTIDLPFQSITTKDGKAVDVSANFVYIVTDAVSHYCNVQDFQTNFPRLAARHVMSKVRCWTYDELMARQSELESSMRDTFNTRLGKRKWGVEIVDAGFTDLVLTKQYRIHGLTSIKAGE